MFGKSIRTDEVAISSYEYCFVVSEKSNRFCVTWTLTGQGKPFDIFTSNGFLYQWL